MIQQLDLFMMGHTQYGVLDDFTVKLSEALQRKGIQTRLIPVTAEGTVSLDWRDLPEATLCFNGIPDSGDELLCDRIAVPHYALLVDPPTRFNRLIESPYMHIGCDDRSGVRLLHEMDFEGAFFFPHAVDKDIYHHPKAERNLDVVLMATYIDHEAIREEWQRIFPESISASMDAVIERVFSDDSKNFIEIFLEEVQKNVPQAQGKTLIENPYIIELTWQLELYIKGKERLNLVRSITKTPLHIFGASVSQKGWKEAIKGQENVTIHPPVSFKEALSVMKNSKVILNSSLKNKEGAHERIFSGMACGAVVVTNQNSFIQQCFQDGKEVILFSEKALDQVDGYIYQLLLSENQRHEIALAGQEQTLRNHTWDNRAEELISQF